MKKLQADTIRGVYEVESFEHEVTLNENIFFEELRTLEDGEVACCEVSEEMYNKIKEKYGIKN